MLLKTNRTDCDGHCFKITLGNYLCYIQTNTDDKPLYVFDNKFEQRVRCTHSLTQSSEDGWLVIDLIIALPSIQPSITHFSRLCVCVFVYLTFSGVGIVAYVVPHTGQLVPAGHELRRFLEKKLPNYMVPAAFVVLKSIPLTPNGKAQF